MGAIEMQRLPGHIADWSSGSDILGARLEDHTGKVSEKMGPPLSGQKENCALNNTDCLFTKARLKVYQSHLTTTTREHIRLYRPGLAHDWVDLLQPTGPESML